MPFELNDVSFGYPDRPIFAGLSLRIDDAELVALLGPSGTGKSTLLSVVAGHLRPQSGTVTWPESLVKRGRPDPGAIGWIMQTANVLVRRTAIDNVALPLIVRGMQHGPAREVARQALADVRLSDRAGDRCFTLSGGERQRVVVARVLATEPAVVLADEPTASLDHANRDLLVESLQAATRRGATVIVATHDLAVADACDRVIRL